MPARVLDHTPEPYPSKLKPERVYSAPRTLLPTETKCRNIAVRFKFSRVSYRRGGAPELERGRVAGWGEGGSENNIAAACAAFNLSFARD